MAAQLASPPIQAPAPVAPSGSIMDVARVVPASDLWQTLSGVYPSYNAGPIRVIQGLCTDTPAAKTLDTPVWSNGYPFSVYKAVGCKSIGFDNNPADGTAAFAALEARGVEQALGTILLAVPATVVPGLTTANIVCAFAALAQYAAQNYAGQPTYLMARSVAVRLLAARVLVREGGKLVTPFGDPVAASGGWDGSGNIGATPGPWMLALGQLTLLQLPPAQQTALNTTDNQVVTLVERMYAAIVDANFVAAAPVAACAALP
jgi:hypothetical protein